MTTAASRRRLLLTGLALLIAVPLAGCRGKPGVELTPSIQVSSVGSERITAGTLTVVIKTQDDHVLRLHVNSPSGLIFQTQPPIAAANGGKEAEIESISIRGGESRSIRFPFAVDGALLMSGGYTVDVAAYEADPKANRPVAEARTIAYLQALGGGAQLVTSRDALLASYPKLTKLRETQFGVAMVLADGDRPKYGMVTVEVPSNENGYAPEVRLSVGQSACIRFKETNYAQADISGFAVSATLPPIDKGGSRILQLPFVVNPAAFEGSYLVELAADWNDKTRQDRLPVMVGIQASSMGGGDRWLELTNK